MLAFEIVGFPTYQPEVGEIYQLGLVFERTDKEDVSPLVDGVWVTWEVQNGPTATVSAQDTYSISGKSGADL